MPRDAQGMSRISHYFGRASPSDAASSPERLSPSPAPRLPVSGSEPPYDALDPGYGTPRGRRNNNCYAYALTEVARAGARKLQPGNLSLGGSGGSGGNTSLSCVDLRRLALRDSPASHAYEERAEVPCRAGYYKVMGFVAPGRDFHWYKQNGDLVVRPGRAMRPTSLAEHLGVRREQVEASSGAALPPGRRVVVRDARLWSHKRGFATGPLLQDACGRAIADPRRACRDYSAVEEDGADYSRYCGALCVASGAKTPPPA